MLSADGCVDTFTVDDLSCCPPPLCGNDLCCTFVAFFNLLPSGPMWDYWKKSAIDYFQHHDDPAQCPLITNPQCPSLILHAIYTVLKLRGMVHGALWVAYRESNPYTAVTTLDNHLARLKWEDCYAQHCRSVLLGEMTPLEVWTECGPLFCPPNYPSDLENALKRAIVISLTRANMGIIKNLCGINWIVDPLGAEIVPIIPEGPDNSLPDTGYPECDPSVCTGQSFLVRHTRDWLEGVGTGDVCDTTRQQVPAYWDQPCDKPAGLPDRVWPGVLAAECIIRSMMPPTCPSNITREC
jgi:hypothetical protein